MRRQPWLDELYHLSTLFNPNHRTNWNIERLCKIQAYSCTKWCLTLHLKVSFEAPCPCAPCCTYSVHDDILHSKLNKCWRTTFFECIPGIRYVIFTATSAEFRPNTHQTVMKETKGSKKMSWRFAPTISGWTGRLSDRYTVDSRALRFWTRSCKTKSAAKLLV